MKLTKYTALLAVTMGPALTGFAQSVPQPASRPDIVASATVSPRVATRPPVPPSREEFIPLSPGPDYVWTPGGWSWDGNAWMWIGGRWGNGDFHRDRAIEPVRPSVEPLHPTIHPLQPTIDPLHPMIDPVHPTIEPVRPTIRPIKPTIEPVRPAMEPTRGGNRR